jgi:hypothetical protein
MRLRSHTAIPVRSDPLARWHGLWEYETHRVPAGATLLNPREGRKKTEMVEPHPFIGGAVSHWVTRVAWSISVVCPNGNLRITIVRRRCPEQNARALWFASLSHFWLKWCLEVA